MVMLTLGILETSQLNIHLTWRQKALKVSMKTTIIEFYELRTNVSSFIETPNIKVSVMYENKKQKLNMTFE